MPLTAKQLIEKIEALVGIELRPNTVDRIIDGDPDTPVTGAATTFIAPLDILKQAHAAGCNFVITHEPTFFNHLDELDDWQGDPVVEAKRKWIADHNMVVYRFHDTPHMFRPDMIVAGVIEKLGWPQPKRNERGTQLVTLPPMPLSELAADVVRKTGGNVARFIGDPSQMCSTIALCVGSPGPRAEFPALRNPDVDVMIIGECNEWASGEYVRDANLAGRTLGLIFLGHRNSEEAGMEWISRWLNERLPVEVRHLVVSDPVSGAADAP